MMQTEMEGYYHGRSESWQEGEKGEHIRDCIESQEALLNDIDQLDN